MSEQNGYVYQPYPKARYRNGEYMEVADELAHAAAEADGWTDWHSDQARMAAAANGESSAGAEHALPADATTTAIAAAAAEPAPQRKKPGPKPKAR